MARHLNTVLEVEQGSLGIVKSEGVISRLTGDGTNVGASHGYGGDYSYSSSSN